MNQKNTKEKEWNNFVARFEEEADRNGLGLDEGIKKTVIGLNALGFNTTQSCEGHLDSGRPFPWVRVESPNEPKERFENQKKIITETAEKYKCSYEEVERCLNKEAYTEALQKYIENPETEEYKKWEAENKKLEMQAQKLLDDFYGSHEVNDVVKLVPDEFGGSFEIMSKANVDWRPSQKITEKEKELLEVYQKEMNTFGEFLKKKFFED